MNKTLKILQASLVMIFVLVNIYLMVFNWKIYSVSLVVNYGFGSFTAPLVLMVVLIDLAIILLFWFVSYTKDLRHELTLIKVSEELNSLRNKEDLSIQQSNEDQIMKIIDQMQQQIDSLREQKSTGMESIEEVG